MSVAVCIQKYILIVYIKKVKGKGHPQQAVEMAQRGPGSLRPRNT